MKLIGVLFLSTLVFILICITGVNQIKTKEESQKIFAEKQYSLILGTSRAAKLNAELISKPLIKNNFIQQPIFNYAFNLGFSPYGPLYSKSILNKIHNKKGVFIICIDPWAISANKTHLNDPSKFKENSTPFSFDINQKFAKLKYFFNYYNKPYYTLFLTKKEKEQHAINKPNLAYIEKHQKAKLKNYKDGAFKSNSISDIRLQSFEKLTKQLSLNNHVFFVKLPISKQMIALENKYAPNFDLKLQFLAKKYDIGIIDFYPIADQFLCPDGNHLFWEDANKVSSMIGRIITLTIKDSLRHKDNLLDIYLKDSKAKSN